MSEPKEELRIDFAKRIYNELKEEAEASVEGNTKNLDKVNKYLKTKFTYYYLNYVIKYTDTDKLTYLEKCIFSLLQTQYMEVLMLINYAKPNMDQTSSKIELIDTEKESKANFETELVQNNTVLGKEIKEYPFTFLNKSHKDEIEANKILQQCEDDKKYCVMNPMYYLTDQRTRDYLCCDSNKIKKISDLNDLDELNGNYLYNILPNGDLFIINEDPTLFNHSFITCGQPVICAGFIKFKNNKIISINNSSGHYTPSLEMLQKGITLLRSKTSDIIPAKTSEDTSGTGGITTINFTHSGGSDHIGNKKKNKYNIIKKNKKAKTKIKYNKKKKHTKKYNKKHTKKHTKTNYKNNYKKTTKKINKKKKKL